MASNGRSTSTPVRAIVFDFDGVILESAQIKTEAFVELFSEYPQHSSAILQYHLENQGISRFRKFEWIYQTLLGRELTPHESARLGDAFSDLVFRKILEAPFVPGAREALTHLHARLPLFVASGTPEPELRDIVEKRGLTQFFAGVYGTPAEKPAIVRAIMDAHGWTADEILFVGDALSDFSAATTVGTRFVARVTPEFEATWQQRQVIGWPDLLPLVDYVA